jgi:hypothetical protein
VVDLTIIGKEAAAVPPQLGFWQTSL